MLEVPYMTLSMPSSSQKIIVFDTSCGVYYCSATKFKPLNNFTTIQYAWGAMVTIQWLDACIYWSLPLPAVHTITTITVKLREARLVTKNTVPPVPKVPPSVRSSPHMAASPMIQSQSGTHGGTPRLIANSQKPVYYAPKWQPPQKSADHLHA